MTGLSRRRSVAWRREACTFGLHRGAHRRPRGVPRSTQHLRPSLCHPSHRRPWPAETDRASIARRRRRHRPSSIPTSSRHRWWSCPTACNTPPAPVAVFVGTLAAADATTARFAVQQIRAGSLDGYAVNTIVDVRYNDDIRFLRHGRAVSGRGETRPTHRTSCSSKVRLPAPLFGGDAVIGVDDTDVRCPRVEDGVKTLLADGTDVDTGVLAPLKTAKRSLLRAILKPLGIAFGDPRAAGIDQAADLRNGPCRTRAGTRRGARRSKCSAIASTPTTTSADRPTSTSTTRRSDASLDRRDDSIGAPARYESGQPDIGLSAWCQERAAVARARRSLTACSRPSGSRYSALPATSTLAPAAAAAATVSGPIPPSTSTSTCVAEASGAEHLGDLGDLRLHRGDVLSGRRSPGLTVITSTRSTRSST